MDSREESNAEQGEQEGRTRPAWTVKARDLLARVVRPAQEACGLLDLWEERLSTGRSGMVNWASSCGAFSGVVEVELLDRFLDGFI